MSDLGKDPDSQPDQLDAATEALLRSVLDERASLAHGSIVPNPEAHLARRSGLSGRLRIPAAIAACAALVLAGVVTVAARRSDQVTVSAASPSEVLAKLQQSDATASFAFVLEQEVRSDGLECSSDTTASGRVDLQRGVVQVDLEDGGQLTLSSVGDGTVTAKDLPSSWEIGTPFVGFTIEQAARAEFALGPESPLSGGISVDPFGSSGGIAEVSERIDELRRSASSVEVVGSDLVRGVETTHVAVQLDAAELEDIRNETNGAGAESLLLAELLTQEEVDAIESSPPNRLQGGIASDDDQRVDAWIDADGQVRRMVISTSLHPSDVTSAGSGLGTNYVTTLEAFDYRQVDVVMPESGVTPLGSLPADVLRPVDHGEVACGQAPVEQVSGCAATEFDKVAAGRTVDDFLRVIPKTVHALVTPNAWFAACSGVTQPFPAPTDDEVTRMIEVTRMDPLRVEAFLTATDAIPSAASVPRPTRFFQALTAACPALSFANGDVDTAASMYFPAAMAGGLSVEGYRAILGLLADPAITICP